VTPFDDDGVLAEGLLRAQLQFMAQADLGIYVCGQGTGEGDLLSDDERVRIFAIAADELRGRRPVGAGGIGLGHPTAVAVRLARAAQDAGLDAVQVMGPRPGPRRPLDLEIETYFRAIIEAVECEVHLANNLALMNYGIPSDMLDRLVADYPHVRAVLLSDGSMESLNQSLGKLVARYRDRLDIRTGITSSIAAVHALGGAGVLGFEANIAPNLTARVWRLLEAGDDPGVGAAYATLLRLNMVLSRFGNPRSVKAALRVIGRDGGVPRRPYLPLPPDATAELARELSLLELD
jgi:4-hydroxy-tetrahydrodipicolinate synthase